MEPELNPINPRKILLGNIALVIIKSIAYLVVVLLAIVLGLGLISTILPDTSGFDQLGLYLGTGIVWAIGILSLAFLLIWANGNIQILGIQDLGIALVGYLSFFLLVAIVEEVICRGYLLQMVTDHLNYQVGIAVSAIVFTLAHLANDHFTWIAFCNLTLGGILMSLLYLKYQSLYVPIGFHWLWNYFQGNILGFGVSGTDVLGLLQINIEGPDWITGGYFGLEGSLLTGLLLAIAIYLLWINTKDQLALIAMEKKPKYVEHA